MRAWGWALLVLGCLTAGRARAGVYNPADLKDVVLLPTFVDSPGKPQFRDVIFALRMIPLDRPTENDHPMRLRYALIDELASRSSLGSLSKPEDKLQISAVLIRRQKYEKAELYLRPLVLREPDNFLLQSNLAAALHGQGKLQEAWDVLNEALRRKKHWPEHWTDLSDAQRDFLAKKMGWNEGPFQHYRTADTYFLKLLKLRLREKLARKDKEIHAPDALFDDGKGTPAQFVSEAGRFEAGKLARAEQAKLPRDALEIVQQLVAWMPDDLRLYWLLGELYNAQGTESGIMAAHQIFSELDKQDYPSKDSKEIEQRLGVLREAVEHIRLDQERKILSNLNTIEQNDDETQRLDWRTVGVSFGAGFVVSLFAVWQVREIRRRRQAGGKG